MITRARRAWPNGGIPPMTKPVRSFASRAVARRMSGSPATAASRATSTRSGPDDEADHGLQAVLVRGDEDERLDDLAELGRRAAAPPPTAVWVDSGNVVTSRVTPLRCAASRTRWIDGMEGWVGHGAESSIRLAHAARIGRSILGHAGDRAGRRRGRRPVRRSTPPGPAGSSPAPSSSPPTAAPGTPRRSAWP